MPTFFVIGAAKCGTTSLHHYLDLHPEISMSKVKEPNYFSDARESQVINSIRTRAAYSRLFESGFRVRGEASTSYSMFPLFDGVPEAIAAEVPNAKFIYLVRDPIARLRSMAGLILNMRFGPFRDMSPHSSVEQLLDHGEEAYQWLTCAGLYMSQIRRYLEYFGEESLLIVDSLEMLDHRAKTISHIYEHVGADPSFTSSEFEIRLNVTESNRRLTRTYLHLAGNRILRSCFRRLPSGFRLLLIERARRILSAPPSGQPEISVPLQDRLRELYGPEVEELRSFTGQRFSSWSV